MSSSKKGGKGKSITRVSSNPTGDSSVPRPEDLAQAASTLKWALDTIGVMKYGFIGGGAMSILAGQYGLDPRQTNDLDLIIQPTPTMTADVVSRNLTTDDRVKDYFVSKIDGYTDKPHVIVYRGDKRLETPIEIFDYHVWPDRRHYYNLDLPANATQNCTIAGRQAPVLTPPWLLRQKILSYAQRQNKSRTDMIDITSLYTILSNARQTIEIADLSEVAALQVVVASTGAPPLHRVIMSEAIFPTNWTWSESHKDHYRYDETRILVWGKNHAGRTPLSPAGSSSSAQPAAQIPAHPTMATTPQTVSSSAYPTTVTTYQPSVSSSAYQTTVTTYQPSVSSSAYQTTYQPSVSSSAHQPPPLQQPASTSTSGWVADENGSQRFWNGERWVWDYEYTEDESKSHSRGSKSKGKGKGKGK